MKIFLVMLGIACLVIGIQDGIRILVDNNDRIGIFNWIPGGFTVHIALDTALAVSGILLTRHTPHKKS